MGCKFPKGFEDFHFQNMAFLETKIREIRKMQIDARQVSTAARGGQNMGRLFVESARDVLEAAEYKKWLRHEMKRIGAGKPYDHRYFTQGPEILTAMAKLFSRLYQPAQHERPLHEKVLRHLGVHINA